MRRSVPAYVQPPIMGELNITPLIDVLLVLLVMFIVTLPMATHEVPIELPQPGPTVERKEHLLVLARGGAASLDGVVLEGAALAAGLRRVAAEPGAALVMRTDPDARYDRFAGVLAEVKRAGVTRLGFAGNAPLAF